MQSIDSKILSRIYGRGKGCVVTPGDFLDLGSRQAVDLALHRLAKKGTLRRLARGLYDYPRIDMDLAPLSPTTDAEEIFTDTFETQEILANFALMKKLKRGHRQAELRKGRFVE